MPVVRYLSSCHVAVWPLQPVIGMIIKGLCATLDCITLTGTWTQFIFVLHLCFFVGCIWAPYMKIICFSMLIKEMPIFIEKPNSWIWMAVTTPVQIWLSINKNQKFTGILDLNVAKKKTNFSICSSIYWSFVCMSLNSLFSRLTYVDNCYYYFLLWRH